MGASVLLADELCLYQQVRVSSEGTMLKSACEQFLGKSVNEIRSVVLQTLEGHLRSILGKSYVKM